MFTQSNLQRDNKEWLVVALTNKFGAYAFRTENPFSANDQFTLIHKSGDFDVLALYDPPGNLIRMETKK